VGAVDRLGELAVPMEFGEVGEFSGGLAYAMRDGRYGYIDPGGTVKIDLEYDLAATFHNGLAVVEQDSMMGVIDTRGMLVVPFIYDWIEGFEQHVSRVRKSGKLGVISPFGDVLLPVTHDHVGTLNDSLMLVVDGAKCGYVNAGGQWVIKQDYDAPDGVATWGDFHNGFAEVQKAGKRALIDPQGRRLSEPSFQDIGRVEGRLIPVKKKDKWGYADRAMAAVVPYKYDLAWEPKNGLARVRSAALFGLIDSTGKVVIAPEYESMTDADPSGAIVVTKGGRAGVIDAAGAVLVPLEYDAAELVPTTAGSAARLVKLTRNKLLAYYRIDTGKFIWKEAGFEATGGSSPGH
jgi:hypothetical protein